MTLWKKLFQVEREVEVVVVQEGLGMIQIFGLQSQEEKHSKIEEVVNVVYVFHYEHYHLL